MQVHAPDPIGRLHGRDLLVARVVDHALAVARAVVGVALKPGQHRLSLVLLDPEIGGQLIRGQRLEPDQVARRVEDHRPVLERAVLRGQEDVAVVGGGGALIDRDRRRLEARLRVEVLDAVRPGRDHRQLQRGERPERGGDLERERPVRAADDVQPGGDGHGFAGGERRVGNEAPAVAVGVGLDLSAVGARARPHDRDRPDLRRRDPPERDLLLGQVPVRAGAREHAHRRLRERAAGPGEPRRRHGQRDHKPPANPRPPGRQLS